ncbi:MAG: PEP-CTERM sorting domain-containing protein [Gemmatimonadaceae bacterium]
MNQNRIGKPRTAMLVGAAAVVLSIALPNAGVAQAYANNFQAAGSENNALAASGTLSTLGRVSLPTDAGGIGSANQSMWLGPVGYGVGKSTSGKETITLSLSGLTVGATYNVAFDLFIGGSWDGSAGGYGPDRWSFSTISGANQNTLVDATFSNCGISNQLCGASSPQSYSDATPKGGFSATTFAPTTGADFSNDVSYPDYSKDYGIYYFGHGAGNPMLNFIAGASTASLVFQREVTGDLLDSSDEYWALDNILVTGAVASTTTPEPSSLVLLTAGLVVLGYGVRRKVR